MVSDERFLPYGDTVEAEAEIGSKQDSYERAQARTLEIDASWREAYVEREKQRMHLRSQACEHAVAVCLGLAFYLFLMAFMIWIGSGTSIAAEAQVAIFATPIVAIAAITIFVLRGVFSGFSEKSFTEDVSAVTQFSKHNSSVN